MEEVMLIEQTETVAQEEKKKIMKQTYNQEHTKSLLSDKQTFKTICRLCGARCPVILSIKDNRIVDTEAMEGGIICPKGKALGEIVHSPERLLYPMKREENSHKAISWDEALQFIADKLKDIKRKYGPQALDIHMGYGTTHSDVRDYIRRFGNLYSTPNLSSSGGQCYTAITIGNSLTYGNLPVADYERSNCIILWGCNPSSSNFYTMKAVLDAVKRGAKLIIIDPKVTPLVSHADIHLQLRPGTNRALALGILHVIVREELYDKDFVEFWTLGFNSLKESLHEYSPERVEEMTGVPADLIRHAARMYTSKKGACIAQGNAPELHIDGVQIIRCIAILQAITGNLDVPGGAMIDPGYRLGDIGPELEKPETKALGADTYPLFCEFKKECQANLIADAVLEETPYPIKGMIVAGANPALTFPNSNKLKKALEKLEFLAVMDIFMTETAENADIVLPATTFLERTEICNLRPYRPFANLALIPPAVPAQGESWPDWKFWFELAKKMGYDEHFPWKDIREATASRLRPLDITIEQLEKEPDGILFKNEQYKKYEKDGFATPSGKVEIYSKRLESLGYNPLPTYKIEEHNNETIILSIGARASEYTHSRFRNIPYLRRRRPEPLAEISPQTAEKLGINDGDRVTIKTKVGEIETNIQIKDSILTGTIFILHGWKMPNANILADDENLDPISGFPPLRALPCTVKKKAATPEASVKIAH
jgi:anaerobic selenocysteine-containing dehydrogenase